MKQGNSNTDKQELTGYENMPKWGNTYYRTWRDWAKACFDAGRKESDELQEENKALRNDMLNAIRIEAELRAANKELREVLEMLYERCIEKGTALYMFEEIETALNNSSNVS